MAKMVVKKVQANFADRNQQIHLPPLATHVGRLNAMYMATTLRAQT